MILQALDRYYDRMAARGEAEPFGWGTVPIGWVVELSANGEPVAVLPLLDPDSNRPRPRPLSVPGPVKRASGIAPNLFWDKTAYTLGRTAGDGKRTALEHAAFKRAMLDLISDSEDAGLVALRRFLETWNPERFDSAPFRPEMLDGNLVFRLGGELGFIHERPAAKALLERHAASAAGEEGEDQCLVTGVRSSPLRLHPTIKGVYGAQSAGASLVSFNLDAFKSYGREQGANAPTSAAAGHRYGAALNAMLARGSRNRLPRTIGDATVVFWADASGADETAAAAAESWFAQVFSAPDGYEDDGDAGQTAKLRDALVALAEGRGQDIDPRGVRFHVLGLAPNAARLAVRFWLSDTFEAFAASALAHLEDVSIEPRPGGWPPGGGAPSLWRLLIRTTAAQEKPENVPPLLAGEVMRAVLGGGSYPRSWLMAALMRLRAGDDPATGWHAAAIKACINRQNRVGRRAGDRAKEDLPVALDPDHDNTAYQLGRLFAVLEAAQYAALGRVNATVADRYYGSASATPARVFPTLLRNARHHVSDAKKRGGGGWVERKLDEVIARLPPDLPATLTLEDQGRFAVGYYHERASRPPKVSVEDENAATEDAQA